MLITCNSEIVEGGAKISNQTVACRETGVLSAHEGRSGLSCFRRAGCALAVFFLAFCLLGIDDARAGGERELFSVEFYPTEGRSVGSNPSYVRTIYRGVFRSSNDSKYKFDFDGVTYKVEKVVPDPYLNEVLLETTPKFPPDGQVSSKFYLHLGNVALHGQYLEAVSLRFSDARVSGNEKEWDQSIDLNTWHSSKEAVVKITGPVTPNNSLRFADYPYPPENEDSGRLEIFDAGHGDDGLWKWICDDGFGEEEAQVACRQMSLATSGAEVWELPEDWLEISSTGFEALFEAIYIANLLNTPALLDDVDCDGDESRLIDCDHAGRGVSDCAVSEAVGVTCQEDSGDGGE